MAKADKKANEVTSALEVAWSAYEAGDMVLARQAAQQVLAKEPTRADIEAAKRLKKHYGKDAPEDARAMAADLVDRSRGLRQPYVFAAVTAVVYLLMLLFASRA